MTTLHRMMDMMGAHPHSDFNCKKSVSDCEYLLGVRLKLTYIVFKLNISSVGLKLCFDLIKTTFYFYYHLGIIAC